MISAQEKLYRHLLALVTLFCLSAPALAATELTVYTARKIITMEPGLPGAGH